MSEAVNMQALGAEMEWFGAVLENCLIDLGMHEGEKTLGAPPGLPPESWYGRFVKEHGLAREERLTLVLALLPHVKPETLNSLLRDEERRSRFGGYQGRHFPGVLPTVQTALALLGGSSLPRRLDGYALFAPDGPLLGRGILRLGPRPPEEPPSAAPLIVDEEVLSRLLLQRPYAPGENDFPARRLDTLLDWDDLVLPPVVLRQLQDILDWAAHGDALRERLGLGKHLRPGFKALFHGPPGTGKTLTAGLIGKRTGLPVYRVDLSRVVSKYIGETEKNLEQLFRLAENRNWIIFFDEADALFNKRTDVEDAHDRHANQETAYLLQRLENYPNLVIMATNMQENIDSAFVRRFNSGIFFSMPGRSERARLWSSCLGARLQPDREALDAVLDIELSGGQIANIALRLGIWALRADSMRITVETLKRAVALERALQGKY